MVSEDDYAFVHPNRSRPIVTPILGYNWRESRTEDWLENSDHWDWPIYDPEIMNRNLAEYWDYVVDELLLARTYVISAHARGAWYPDDDSQIGKGTGDMDPRLLSNLVAALDRVDARHTVKFAMWEDTGMWDNNLEKVTGASRFDFSNSSHCEFEYDHNIKLWYETVPRDMWYEIDGRPVITFWTITGDMINPEGGNARDCLDQISDLIQQDFDVEPAYILQKKWFEKDPSVEELDNVIGMHNWFNPNPGYRVLWRYSTYDGFKAGAIAPAYTDSSGDSERDMPRNDGNELIDGLEAGQDADWILLEGWTNMIEGAGFYRSSDPDWLFVNQYNNITRRYADPRPETLRFQAEGADDFNDTTNSNTLGDYSSERALDVRRFSHGGSGELPDESGWYVGDIESGEWLQYREVYLGDGTYRFTARVATSGSASVRFSAIPSDGGSAIVSDRTLPDTNDDFDYVHLGELQLPAGDYDLRIEFLSNKVEKFDWFHMRRN